MTRADLILVGAGSAGCVLASQLAQEHGFHVLLVEPESLEAPSVDRQRPARWLNLLGSEEDWDLATEPAPRLAGRKIHWPRGRGLGGSSRINAMIWFPPTDQDFQMLSAASGGLWTDGCLRQAYSRTLAIVQPEPPRWLSDASIAFMESVSDMPDAVPMIYPRVNRHGRRWNPANLLQQDDATSSKGRIEVVRATVEHVLWDGDKAVGVRTGRDASSCDLRATHGVVLSAGAIASPMLLMRSGIGNRTELSKHSIDARVDRLSVGKNLQDHLLMPVIFQTKFRQSFSARSSVRDVARWQTIGAGPLTSNIAECGGLFHDQQVQIHVTPTHYLTYPQSHSGASVMTIGVSLTQPMSRGEIELGEVGQAPPIRPGYLNDEADLEAMVDAVSFARTLTQRSPLGDCIIDESLPGEKRDCRETIAKSIERYAQTLYHPVGTCGLGNRSDSVLRADFTVRGTEQLWVADASILPQLTVGNPNAIVMSLAMLAADQIAGQSGFN